MNERLNLPFLHKKGEKMNRKFLIIAVFIIGISVQYSFAQVVGSLGINIETTTHYDEAEWKLTPLITFRVFGEVESGSQLSVEYTSPTGKPFLTAKCDTYPQTAKENRRYDLCGKDLEQAQATNQTGLYSFQIKLGNPLNGTSKVLYSGKFTIGKILYNPDGTPDKNKQFHYFTDNDWRLQYAYVGTYYGDLSNNLYVEFWVKTVSKTILR